MTPPLRQWLAEQGSVVSYAEVMQALDIPHMNILTQALELLMQEDAAAGRPLLAARVVSRSHPLPNRGFFDLARSLGYEVGDEAAFHAAQLAALGKPEAKP